MKLSRIELVKAVQGIPPDKARRRDVLEATADVEFYFDAAEEVVEVSEVVAGKREVIYLIPRDNVAGMTPAK